jgi:hypothetical protein
MAALALVPALLLPAAGVTLAGGGGSMPDAQTRDATQVTAGGATLQGWVKPRNSSTTYWFQYGTTNAYGQSTPTGSAGDDDEWSSVARTVTGLAPGTTYHFRVVAAHGAAIKPGLDKTFTTIGGGAPGAPGSGVPGPGSPGAPDVPGVPGSGVPGSGVPGDGGVADRSAPELGKSVGVDPADGLVRVRRPGEAGWSAVDAGGTVPTGTVIDTRLGKVTLTTALGGGATQTATFWGGVFEVRQSGNGHGYTDIHLRGPGPAGCPRTLAVAAKKRGGNSLWGSDKHGRYRTHGRNSVATVRGTSWLTTERCDGTLTWVREGAVAVRDRRQGRTVLVRAGHGHLARARR